MERIGEDDASSPAGEPPIDGGLPVAERLTEYFLVRRERLARADHKKVHGSPYFSVTRYFGSNTVG